MGLPLATTEFRFTYASVLQQRVSVTNKIHYQAGSAVSFRAMFVLC